MQSAALRLQFVMIRHIAAVLLPAAELAGASTALLLLPLPQWDIVHAILCTMYYGRL